MTTIEEAKEFVRKIPKTPEGKLEALNKFILKEENMEEAFKTMIESMNDLFRERPDYFEALKDCKTEEEIKQKSGEFFEKNPDIVQDVMLSLMAGRRNKMEKADYSESEK